MEGLGRQALEKVLATHPCAKPMAQALLDNWKHLRIYTRS